MDIATNVKLCNKWYTELEKKWWQPTKFAISRKVKIATNQVNSVISYVNTASITETRWLIQEVANVVADIAWFEKWFENEVYLNPDYLNTASITQTNRLIHAAANVVADIAEFEKRFRNEVTSTKEPVTEENEYGDRWKPKNWFGEGWLS